MQEFDLTDKDSNADRCEIILCELRSMDFDSNTVLFRTQNLLIQAIKEFKSYIKRQETIDRLDEDIENNRIDT